MNRDRILALLSGMAVGVLVTTLLGGLWGIQKLRSRPHLYREDTNTLAIIGGQAASPQTAAKTLESGFKVYAADALDRIFQDGRTLLAPHFSDHVAISEARNEYESFQVVITNGRDALNNVRFELSDLQAQDGEENRVRVLGKDSISWRVVGYVPTKRPYYAVKYVGMWPDPLLPGRPVSIAAGVTQPFWFTIYVPKDTIPGAYKGKVKLFVNDAFAQDIPLQVEILPFTLPRASSLKTAFDFYGHITSKRYPVAAQETDEAYQARIADLNDTFIIKMVKCRMDPVLNVDLRSEQDLAKVDRYMSYGMSNFSIGKYGGSFNNNWPRTDEGIEKLFDEYRALGELLTFHGWLTNHYIYTWDEGDMGASYVAKVANMIHRAHPRLKNMVCYHGFWDPVKYPKWGDDIDIWTFQISDYDQKRMETMLKLGKEMWIYVSGPGSDGTPNLVIDADSIEYRILPWMCWKFHIKGFLYWCVNWWPFVDPYKNAANTEWDQNGNGLLFYPGDNGPINSMRAEIFRDGMEDYEYLTLLKNALDRFSQLGLQDKYSQEFRQANGLLSIDRYIAASFKSYTREATVIQERRKNIAEAIVKIMTLSEKEGRQND